MPAIFPIMDSKFVWRISGGVQRLRFSLQRKHLSKTDNDSSVRSVYLTRKNSKPGIFG